MKGPHPNLSSLLFLCITQDPGPACVSECWDTGHFSLGIRKGLFNPAQPGLCLPNKTSQAGGFSPRSKNTFLVGPLGGTVGQASDLILAQVMISGS